MVKSNDETANDGDQGGSIANGRAITASKPLLTRVSTGPPYMVRRQTEAKEGLFRGWLSVTGMRFRPRNRPLWDRVEGLRSYRV
jgi:hypothetical protein